MLLMPEMSLSRSMPLLSKRSDLISPFATSLPKLWSMDSTMLFRCDQSKVFQIIVKWVTVDMMNVIPFWNRPERRRPDLSVEQAFPRTSGGEEVILSFFPSVLDSFE